MIDKEQLWNEIPVGEHNAVTYAQLCNRLKQNRRNVRKILHELSLYDSGDNYILIRSANGKGFYRTDNIAQIKAFRKECLNKGRSNFAPLKKINRVLKNDRSEIQYSVFNNLKAVRNVKGLTQNEVISKLFWTYGVLLDVPTLSKMENGVFIPKPEQVYGLAKIYGVQPNELFYLDDYALGFYSVK